MKSEHAQKTKQKKNLEKSSLFPMSTYTYCTLSCSFGRSIILILRAENVRDYYFIYLLFPDFTNLGWPITFHGGEEDCFGCEW